MDAKGGRRDDPYDDGDADESAGEAVRETSPERDTSPTDQEIPYILRRSSVKAGRSEKSVPLQQSTLTLEGEVREQVEDAVDADVYDSDLREAALLVGLRHADEVADVLLEWGYEFR